MDRRFQNQGQYMLLLGRLSKEGGKGVASKVEERPGECSVREPREERTAPGRERSTVQLRRHEGRVNTQVPKSTCRHPFNM